MREKADLLRDLDLFRELDYWKKTYEHGTESFGAFLHRISEALPHFLQKQPLSTVRRWRAYYVKQRNAILKGNSWLAGFTSGDFAEEGPEQKLRLCEAFLAAADTEIALRSRSGSTENTLHADGTPEVKKGQAGKVTDPEVAKRRALVKGNPGINAEEMCEIFDRQHVPLSLKWQVAGLKTWKETYDRPEYRKYRKRIDVLISKDRQSH